MGKVFTHPGQPQMQVEVILASQSTVPQSMPIFTIRMRYPRPIHGEVMTHRVFSRNARSSRAVPVKTMLNEVRNIPYVPWHWGKNQKGMQASEECNAIVVIPDYCEPCSRETAWLSARDIAADTAEAFMEAGYHKQNPNRLLEPFSWIDTLITSTDWANFLWLREHEDAEPHLQDLATLVRAAMADAAVQDLNPNEWHLPYITQEDHDWADAQLGGRTREKLLCKISAARCARISYTPFDGDASYEKEIERYDLLVTSDRVHASPTEHQATPDIERQDELLRWVWELPELHGNFDGYIQARKLIPNEAYRYNNGVGVG